MTNTPDLASIIKPLKEAIRTDDGYVQFSNKSLFIDYVIGPDSCLGYYVKKESTDRWLNDSYQEAVKKKISHYNQLILSALDLTKLQPQPDPFWKPIEQCSKEWWKAYLIKDNENCPYMAVWAHKNEVWVVVVGGLTIDPCDVTHYAEIPACEVKP